MEILLIIQKICPVGVHFAQTLVHFAHFQGILGWGCGSFVYVHIPERGL